MVVEFTDFSPFEVYRSRWVTKLAWYRTQGILPFEDGGGPAGALVTSRDDERGGIDNMKIEALVRSVFGA